MTDDDREYVAFVPIVTVRAGEGEARRKAHDALVVRLGVERTGPVVFYVTYGRVDALVRLESLYADDPDDPGSGANVNLGGAGLQAALDQLRSFLDEHGDG